MELGTNIGIVGKETTAKLTLEQQMRKALADYEEANLDEITGRGQLSNGMSATESWAIVKALREQPDGAKTYHKIVSEAESRRIGK